MTFFATCEPKLLPIPLDQKIETEPFIKAANNIPKIFDKLGPTAFAAVKKDINGNITKLTKVHDKDAEKFKTLNAMLEDDIATDNTKNDSSATVALLWLTRGLEYIVLLLQELLKNKKEGTVADEIKPACKNAYETALKPFHGWMIQKVFGLALLAAPYTKDFIKALGEGECDEEKVYADMEEFTTLLASHVEVIKAMMGELKLDSQEKA